MTRQRDRIDVMLDEPVSIDMATAWSDLRAVIYEATGADIERGTQFSIRALPVRGSGNRITHAFVAAPRDATTPDDMVRRGYLSLYGELPQWAADDVREGQERGLRPIFAVPMATAMRRMN